MDILMFGITLQTVGGVAVLRVQGDLLFGPPVDSLRLAVRDLVGSNQARVLLDLANVRRIDSSGLGALLALRADVESAEGSLVLLAPPGRLRALLTATRFASVFQIADTEAAAAHLLADVRQAFS